MQKFNEAPAPSGTPEDLETFLKNNKDNLLAVSVNDVLEAENSTRRQNGVPELVAGDVDVVPGSYASNNDIFFIRGKEGSSYIAVGASQAELQQAGFANVPGGFVPFSNGLAANIRPDIISFITKGRQRVSDKHKEQDAKYSVV
jgi:hypothetical protein